MRHFLLLIVSITIILLVFQTSNEASAVYDDCSPPPACLHNSCSTDKIEQQNCTKTVSGLSNQWLDATFEAMCSAEVTCNDCGLSSSSVFQAQDLVQVRVPGEQTKTSSCTLASASLGGTTCTCTKKAIFTLVGEYRF